MIALLLLGACSRLPPPPPAHPTVALLTIDTWRLDTFTAALTPHLWELAQRGERFTQAWSPMGLTTPSHATMLTGLMPWEHGMQANNHHGYTLASQVQTFPQTMDGWARGAFVSAYPAGPSGGMGRGWDVFDAPDSGERSGSVAVEHALAWLPDDRPALLWVHLYEPHGPYQGSASTDAERYKQEVTRADSLLAPLIDVLVQRRATIVVAADHGEVWDEETCGWQHERSSSEAVLHVPLFRWVPEAEPRVHDELVGLADVPALLRGESVAAREHWLAQSGLCEPGCSPGCTPEGLQGRDRVVVSATGRWVQRPGRGTWKVGSPPDALASLLDTIPPVSPPSADAPEGVAPLGYVDP